jgi:hypothetical protein
LFSLSSHAEARKGFSQRVRVDRRRAGSGTLNLYMDASALVKRYVAEPESGLVRELMARAAVWFICRVGFLETARAVSATVRTIGRDDV